MWRRLQAQNVVAEEVSLSAEAHDQKNQIQPNTDTKRNRPDPDASRHRHCHPHHCNRRRRRHQGQRSVARRRSTELASTVASWCMFTLSCVLSAIDL